MGLSKDFISKDFSRQREAYPFYRKTWWPNSPLVQALVSHVRALDFAEQDYQSAAFYCEGRVLPTSLFGHWPQTVPGTYEDELMLLGFDSEVTTASVAIEPKTESQPVVTVAVRVRLGE